MTTTAQEKFTLLVKTKLLQKKLNITTLAKRLDYARNTVSQAINHPAYYPHVREEIEKELRISL